MAAKPRFAALNVPKGSLLHNDDSIFGRMNKPDANRGGGPVQRPSNPSGHARGGVGAKGQQSKGSGLGGRTHGNSGNPGASPTIPGEARSGAMRPETRVPGHGGSPQHRERETPGDFHKRGGVGASGQRYVPGGRDTTVRPSAGNTSGRSYKLIAGRFKRAAMGARSTGGDSRGQYGGAPVTSNT